MGLEKIFNMKIANLVCFVLVSCFAGCSTEPPGGSPPGYDLGRPEKYVMSEDLHEISGIVFLGNSADTLCAIEDEDGRLFYFHPGERKFPSWKFGKKGDYEDVAILNHSELVVLRSDGSLFTFPLSFVQDGNRDRVQEYEHILPAGEYEGLYGDDSSLVALCKNCKEDDQRDAASGYVLRHKDGQGLAITDHFTVDVSSVKITSTRKKIKFHPSCLARHPITRDWYIISAVNKVMLILDDHWTVKASYPLNIYLFKQPEGLAFDLKGNMYISNEGDEGDANVLLFPYNQPKRYEKDPKNH